LIHTPFNEAFCWEKHSSVEGSYYFTKTKDFSEAVELFKNGWSDMATKLVQKLKVIESKTKPTMKPKNVLGVVGYQAIVPLYLQGVPNNMVNRKIVPIKNKVITINKAISVSASVSSETMKAESVKCFQIIKKIEQSGIRATFSYRCMTMITKLEAKGMNLETAMKISIVKGLDKDTINTFNPNGSTKYHNALRKIQLAA
jgi:hypothetical protein